MIEAQKHINELLRTDKDKVGQLSDGYHTFDELYRHRCLLFIALMKSHRGMSWRATEHDDGSGFFGWFIAGMNLPAGPVTYHLPLELWSMLEDANIKTLALAPPWDGHTSKDVDDRLARWITGGAE